VNDKERALSKAKSVQRAVLVTEAAMRGTDFSRWETFAEQAALAFMDILVDDTASPSVVARIVEVFSVRD
jgi:hypothetical protein